VWAPVPDKLIVVGEFVALLVIVTLAPLTVPAVVGANFTARVADCAGVSTVPLEMPLALNPAPVTVTPEIVMFEFPPLVIDVVNEELLSSATFPKLRVVGLAPRDNAAEAPVPDRLITRGEGAPFVVSVMAPLTVVAKDGVKTALKVVLPPAAIVVDVERPVWVKAPPVTAICENVRGALPLFASAIVCELLLPIVTVPKVTLVGLAEICGWAPLAVRAIVRGEPEALLVIDRLPVALAELVGVKVTLKEVVWPGLSVRGERVLILKPVPVMLLFKIERAAVPEFESVIPMD
jgi:hypothetical protein